MVQPLVLHYNKQLQLTDALVLVISQSGRSPDILAQVAMAKAAGAMVVALVNDTTSPLAEQADFVVPLFVGPEKAVAATKSYLATLSALLQLVAVWSQQPWRGAAGGGITCHYVGQGPPRGAAPAAQREDFQRLGGLRPSGAKRVRGVVVKRLRLAHRMTQRPNVAGR